jgi:hypothetical protein
MKTNINPFLSSLFPARVVTCAKITKKKVFWYGKRYSSAICCSYMQTARIIKEYEEQRYNTQHTIIIQILTFHS